MKNKYPYVLGFVEEFDETFRVVLDVNDIIVEKERNDAMGNKYWRSVGRWRRSARKDDIETNGLPHPHSLALLCVCKIADEMWNGVNNEEKV